MKQKNIEYIFCHNVHGILGTVNLFNVSGEKSHSNEPFDFSIFILTYNIDLYLWKTIFVSFLLKNCWNTFKRIIYWVQVRVQNLKVENLYISGASAETALQALLHLVTIFKFWSEQSTLWQYGTMEGSDNLNKFRNVVSNVCCQKVSEIFKNVLWNNKCRNKPGISFDRSSIRTDEKLFKVPSDVSSFDRFPDEELRVGHQALSIIRRLGKSFL